MKMNDCFEMVVSANGGHPTLTRLTRATEPGLHAVIKPCRASDCKISDLLQVLPIGWLSWPVASCLGFDVCCGYLGLKTKFPSQFQSGVPVRTLVLDSDHIKCQFVLSC
jgi:hypothetical protein